MTDISYVPAARNVGNQFRTKAILGRAKVQGFRVENTYWGYIVHGNGAKNFTMVGFQTAAMVFGACAMASAISLVVMPMLRGDLVELVFRAGAAGVFAAIAIYMMWFASRGTVSELQIDTQKGEIRQAVRTRTGKTTVLARHGFDAIGGVFLDRSFRKSGDAALVLRFGNTTKTMAVAQGRKGPLEKLRDRLGRDLML